MYLVKLFFVVIVTFLCYYVFTKNMRGAAMTKGEKIKQLRERIGKSQVDFADAIGVSKQTLYKYENDIITNIPSDKIEAIAELTGTVPEYIMGWKAEYRKTDLKPLENPCSEDIELLKAYNSAPDDIKACVCRILGIEKR